MGTRALALSLLLVPSLAFAQTAGQATLSVFPRVDFDTTQINRAECASTTANVTVSYLPSVSTFTSGDTYRFFASTSACSSTVPSSGSFASDQVATSASTVQTLDVPGNALRGALGLSCTQANDATYYVCIYLTDSGGTNVRGTAFSGALTFQLAVPPRPTISATPANSAIDVTVTPGTTNATYTATDSISYEALATPTAGGNPVSSGIVFSTSLRIENLTNDTDYSVVAYAYSSAGNPSPVSNAVSPVTPRDFKSFWWTYQNAGGREQGGCGGGAGALSPLALIPLALRFRRRRS